MAETPNFQNKLWCLFDNAGYSPGLGVGPILRPCLVALVLQLGVSRWLAQHDALNVSQRQEIREVDKRLLHSNGSWMLIGAQFWEAGLRA